jgi:hypothetical protein
MTTNHHTPITTGAPANASTVNNPLGQLDSAITTLDTSLASSAQSIGAWIPLYSNTLSVGGEFDVDLSTSPATSCDHIIIKMLLRGTGNVTDNLDYVHIAFNTDTTTTTGNYWRQHYFGRGASLLANASQSAQIANAPNTLSDSSAFVVVNLEIPFFRGSHQKIVASNYYTLANTTTLDGWVGQFAVRWLNTAAITRIRIRTDNHPTDKLAIGSKIQVWGIKSLDVLTNSF